MRHQVKSKRIGRGEAHRDLMLRNLASSIVLYEKVRTTSAKAKLIKPVIEKLISTAKNSTPLNAKRALNAYFLDKNASKKLMKELLERYKERKSGFVRLTKLGFRAGDAAPMVQIELV